jgi:acyl-CoA synthetase (AMP-forming)/AMP-acid ligase II
MTIAQFFHKFAAVYPKKGAIWSPSYAVLYDYATVSRLTHQLAGSLSEFGYKRGDVLVSDIPNTHHNLLLQSACSHLGVAVATAKNLETLEGLIEKVS